MYKFTFTTFLVLINICLGNSQSDDLMAKYLFNGDALDSGILGYHGEEYGSVDYGLDRFGNPCAALDLNGINSYIEIPNNSDFEDLTESLSITTWFKSTIPKGDFQWFTIACKGAQNEETLSSPQFRLQGTAKTISLSTDFTVFIDHTIQAEEWYHYALIWNGTTMCLYLNAQLISEFYFTGALSSNSDPILIGRDIPGAEEFFKGMIDDLRIYKKALSSQEVANIYLDESDNVHNPCVLQEAYNIQDSIYDYTNTIPMKDTILPSPEVIITYPSSSTFTVPYRNRDYTVLAKIKSVASQNELEVFVDDILIDTSRYTVENDLVSLVIPYSENTVTIEFVVANKQGRSSDMCQINFAELLMPPVISLKKPVATLVTVDEPIYQFSTNIQNCISSGVSLKLNGSPITFLSDNLDSRSRQNMRSLEISSDLSLKQGLNLLMIEATNQDGKETKFIQFDYVSDPEVDLGKVDTISHVTLPSGDILLECYDHNKIDGDIVSVFLDDKTLFERITLKARQARAAVRKLSLVQGHKYTLVCKAWNEGRIATNTLTVRFSNKNGFDKIFKLSSKKGVSEAFTFIYN